jgi:hypothetical protein
VNWSIVLTGLNRELPDEAISASSIRGLKPERRWISVLRDENGHRHHGVMTIL